MTTTKKYRSLQGKQQNNNNNKNVNNIKNTNIDNNYNDKKSMTITTMTMFAKEFYDVALHVLTTDRIWTK